MTNKEIYDYIYAGNSTFSLTCKTDKFYYNVKQSKSKSAIYKVYSIKPDNLYLGVLYEGLTYPFNRECTELGRTDVWLLEQFMTSLQHEDVDFYITFEPGHTCPRCGKLLTHHKSIEFGYGKECWRKMHD